MKANYLIIIFIYLLVNSSIFAQPYSYEPAPESRNPYKWPFSQTSIWNTPIGSDAVYVHAHLEPALEWAMTVDEDYIIMMPDEPLMDIYRHNAGWNVNRSRCDRVVPEQKMFSAPIPQSWVINPSGTPNAGLAVLMPDKRTIKQTQPFAHCEEGGDGTSQYSFPDQDLYGDGIRGAHGGSGLSAVGGAIRVNELTPTSGPIRHALKVNLYSNKNIYYNTETKGYRWPAVAADSGAERFYYTERTNPVVPDCRMGALLALPPFIDIEDLELETEPAKILAQAFQDYGAYVVDDTAWDVNAIVVEWSPEGRFESIFRMNWGFNFTSKPNARFGSDMAKIFSNLHVVANNSAASIGGGGNRRAPLAPPFETTSNIEHAVLGNEIQIFPTQVDDVLNTHGIEGEIFIIDISGKIILKQKCTEGQSIDLKRLNSGVYFIKTKKGSLSFIKL